MGAAAELRVPASTVMMAQRRKSESGFRPLRASTAPFPPQDIPSDITIEVEGKRFFLHKFPLLSRSGWIRKLLVGGNGGAGAAAARGEDIIVQLPDFPGGTATFELAARFCYGQALEIGSANVVALRCAAEYLDMTDDFGSNNLLGRCEALLKDSLAGGSLGTCVKLLQSCESLMPAAEELDIVPRCIDAVAAKACKEQVAWSMSQSDLSSNSSRFDSNESWGSISTPRNRSLPPKPGENGGTGTGVGGGGGGGETWWWAEELVALRVDFFQRVLAAMRARGLRYDCLGGVIVHYAQQSLKGLIKKQAPMNGPVAPAADPSPMEHQQRILIETVVSLLPPERNVATTSFLFGLLRAAIYLDTTLACRLDLEARIAMQLDSAALDDLLIPAYAFHGDTLFDVDTIRRIVITFLQQQSHDMENLNGGAAAAFYDSADEVDEVYDDSMSPLRSRRCSTKLIKVASLIDSFLAEIAPDANLNPVKFSAIAELMPDHSRPLHDGLYRAIDIYLKAHPGLNDAERKKVCGHMNCRKLSQEACAHAAQNERLPVHVVVQVLYFEQMRLKNAMGATAFLNEFEDDDDDDDGVGSNKSRLQRSHLPPPPIKTASSATRTPQISLRDQLADDEDTIDIDIDTTADRITLDSGTGLSPAVNRRRPPLPNGGAAPPPNDMYSAIFRENQELKMEMARMRMQLSCSTSSCESLQISTTNKKHVQQPIVVDSGVNCTKLSIDHVADPADGRVRRTSLSTAMAETAGAASLTGTSSVNQSNNGKHGSKLLSSFTKTLGKLNPFNRNSKADASTAGVDLKPRRRRHSVS